MQRDNAYLLDMLLSARDAVEFASPITYAEFQRSRLHQNAILKSVEIVGEAASRVSVGTRETYNDIPWGEIVGIRNRIVHAYFAIDIELVWRVVKDDLPILMTQLERIVPPDSSPRTTDEN